MTEELGPQHGSTLVTRMIRDGWTLTDSPNRPWGFVLERKLPHNWTLRCTKAYPRNQYELIQGDQSLPQPSWDWADLDGSRLVYAAGGCLWAARLSRTGLETSLRLHDFSDMKFEPLQAPY